MQIQLERAELLDAVSNLSRAVLNRAAIPVLEGILLSAEDGKLTMMAYNLEIGMTKVITNLKVIKEGDIVLNAKLFLEILRKIKGDYIEISVNESLLCQIKGGNASFDIAGMASEDFPEMPSVAEHKFIKMSGETLKSMVQGTGFAVAQNENARPVLTGIKFEIRSNEIKLIAIDGSRLAIRKAPIISIEECDFIVSGKAIQEAVKTINENTLEISIRVGKKHISFEVDGYFMISRLIEGDYIDYSRTIPAGCEGSFKVNTRELIETIDRISLIINDQLKTPIRMNIFETEILFSSVSAVGRASDVLPAIYSGPAFEIGFNSRYLTEALRATETDEVVMKFNGANSAAVISPVEGDDFLYLIMPMRLA